MVKSQTYTFSQDFKIHDGRAFSQFLSENSSERTGSGKRFGNPRQFLNT